MKRPQKFCLSPIEAQARGKRDALADREFCELIPEDCRSEDSRAAYSRAYAQTWKNRVAMGEIGGAA